MQKKLLSVGVIGAGISGLSVAVKLLMNPLFKVSVFEKNAKIGGRTYSMQPVKNTFADIGANFVDYETKEQQNRVEQFLKTVHQKDHLIPFKHPFMLYENGSLRKGDYEKERFFYTGGFKQIIGNLINKINQVPQRGKLLPKTDITKIQKIDGKWLLQSDNNSKQIFDIIILSCNKRVIKIQTTNPLIESLKKQANEVNYSKQLSLSFFVRNTPNYCSVLFKDHPIIFACSHSEKFPDQPPLVVFQMNQKFSQQYFEKDQQTIVKAFSQTLPPFLKDQVIVQKCLRVKKWWPSLLSPKRESPFEKLQSIQQNLYVGGDIAYGASRVSGAIDTSLHIAQIIEKNASKIINSSL